MAEWKKVVVSGSGVSQLSNNANYVVNGQSGTSLTGSFTGSFAGNGAGLTGVVASTIGNALTSGEGISTFTYNGSAAVTVAVSGAADLTNNNVNKWDNTANKFANSSITDDGTIVSGATSVRFTGATSSLTGSFTGSHVGDGSGLTGLVTTLAVSGSAGNGTVALKTQAFTIAGTANEVETSMAGQTLTIGLPNDVTISNKLTVSGDLVVAGTASFQNTQNLLVADRFVLFASGSVSTGDGGIVVQQGTQNVGELYGYDAAVTRWGFTSSFNSATGTNFTPAVFVGAVQVGTGQTAASTAPIYGGATNGHGTIHVDTDDSEIWIYA
jgi:hypothetical protein